MKKVLIYTLIFLFLFSVYKDLSIESLEDIPETTPETDSTSNYNAVYVKVQHGDTILSIVEAINEESLYIMNIDQIIEDFKLLNPNVNPHQLKTNHYYYFPEY